jgi:hypothetical protein
MQQPVTRSVSDPATGELLLHVWENYAASQLSGSLAIERRQVHY